MDIAALQMELENLVSGAAPNGGNGGGGGGDEGGGGVGRANSPPSGERSGRRSIGRKEGKGKRRGKSVDLGANDRRSKRQRER